jgi:hypothetical protein
MFVHPWVRARQLAGAVSMFDKATKLAGDVTAYVNEQLFAKYCQKFEGKCTGEP